MLDNLQFHWSTTVLAGQSHAEKMCWVEERDVTLLATLLAPLAKHLAWGKLFKFIIPQSPVCEMVLISAPPL
jgi:hypothetical protein